MGETSHPQGPGPGRGRSTGEGKEGLRAPRRERTTLHRCQQPEGKEGGQILMGHLHIRAEQELDGGPFRPGIQKESTEPMVK